MRRAPALLGPVLAAALVSACSSGSTPSTPTTPANAGGPTPTQTTTTSSPTPNPSPALPAGFKCRNFVGGASHAPDWGPAGPTVTAIRIGGHSDFNRFVMQFDGTVPAYKVTRQSRPIFTEDPKGTVVRLKGNHGVLVTVKPENWTAYTGPAHMVPTLAFIREARMVQNFEGTMQWGLGILGNPCLRVTTLTNPPRLVVDVAAKPAQ